MVGVVEMIADEPHGALSLTPEELDLLIRFFRRALRLHETGVISPEAVLEYLKLATDAIDPHHPGSLAALRSALDDAWRQSDG